MSPAGATLAEAGQGRLGVSQVPTDAHLTKAVVDFRFETFSDRYSTDHAAVLPSTVAIHTTVGCSPSSRSFRVLVAFMLATSILSEHGARTPRGGLYNSCRAPSMARRGIVPRRVLLVARATAVHRLRWCQPPIVHRVSVSRV